MKEISEYIEIGNNSPAGLVLLLHGYGSNSSDLINIAPELINYVPDVKFISLNAPESFEGSGFSEMRQWFSLQDRDPKAMYQGVSRASNILEDFIDKQVEKHGINYRRIVLLGFSQGAMLSLHTAYRMNNAIGGVICYSGMMIMPEMLDEEVIVKPPALLIHGEEDEVLLPESMYVASEALKRAGVVVEQQLRPFLGHGIDPTGVALGGEFLRKVLIG